MSSPSLKFQILFEKVNKNSYMILHPTSLLIVNPNLWFLGVKWNSIREITYLLVLSFVSKQLFCFNLWVLKKKHVDSGDLDYFVGVFWFIFGISLEYAEYKPVKFYCHAIGSSLLISLVSKFYNVHFFYCYTFVIEL